MQMQCEQRARTYIRTHTHTLTLFKSVHAHRKDIMYMEYTFPGGIDAYCICMFMPSRMYVRLPRL